MASPDFFASVRGRNYSSGTATSITHGSRYPYDRPAESTANRVSGSTPSPSSLSHSQPKSQSGLMQTINTMIEQIRQMKGARNIWEVAVKRNGMTTSLVLLGGVLLADTMLYPGGKMHRERKAHLAAPTTAGSSSSSSSSNPGSSSMSSSNTARALSTTAAATAAHA